MKLLTLVLTLTLMVSAGCSNKPDSSADGRELFDYHCAGCNKKNGHGQFLSGVPANNNTVMTPYEVKVLITKGHNSKPAMQPVEGISLQEADKIVTYLWSLRGH